MRILVRFELSLATAVALLAGCTGAQPPIGVPGASVERGAPPHSHTFLCTDAKQTFKVPNGVTKITVVVVGAAGGKGGRGGRVFAVIPVTPREMLAVYVGGQPFVGPGGFNGGASGGMNRKGIHDGFGGGGASDIRENGDRLTDRIVVAGGGGGKGGPASHFGAAGGRGGGRIGGAGRSGGASSGLGGAGGTGGTQHSGGLGGSGSAPPHGGKPGADGSFGRGGHGGPGCQERKWCENFGGGGGGGGGGYYGGGGGGGGSGTFYSETFSGGGGGGGSSYVEPSAENVRFWRGWKNATGNGIITLRW